MTENNNPVSKMITDYFVLTEMSRHYGRKQFDLEREYNRLLNEYHGEAKNYSLEQAEKIYTTYREMLDYGEKSRTATESLLESENKLRELGQILYESTIHAEVNLPAVNGYPAQTKTVTVVFQEGTVIIK
jgi:hypothetical protein